MDFIAILIILILFATILLIQAVAEQKWRQDNRELPNSQEKDHYYIAGIYYNILDKRIFVPKRGGGGYTFNFGNPIGSSLFLLLVFGIWLLISYT